MGGLGNTLERRLDKESIQKRNAKIIELHENEGLKTPTLVERFGLSPTAIRRILSGGVSQ